MGGLPVIARLAAMTVAGLVCLVVTAAPAAAHERLEKAEPAADARLDEAPSRIRLTFSGRVTDPDPTLVVRTGDGEAVSNAAPVVDGPTVTLSLGEPLAGGTYAVEWGIISSDGDPVSGEYRFTVATPSSSPTPAAPTTPAASPTPAGSPTTASDPVAAPGTADPSPAASGSDGGSSVWPWLGVAAAVLVALGVTGAVLRRRAG